MTILQVLRIVAAAGTIVTGLISLIRPRSVTGFTGLSPTGPRGVTEIMKFPTNLICPYLKKMRILHNWTGMTPPEVVNISRSTFL